jgi:hypothetical protein
MISNKNSQPLTKILSDMKLAATCLLALVCLQAGSQKQKVYVYRQIDPAKWIIPRTDSVDYQFGQYQGQNALLMMRKFDDYKSGSIAYPAALDFADGTIEADMAWSGKGGGYIGIAFRIKDSHHYDVVYFRPGSSGTINAIQYMPEKKAGFNWWNYEAAKYQAKATLPLHNWFHVKVVVKGSQMQVFIDNQAEAVMVYATLDPDLKTGAAGFWFGNNDAGAYKNLVITVKE